MRSAAVCNRKWTPLIISLFALLSVRGQGGGIQEHSSGLEDYFSGDDEKVTNQTLPDDQEGSADFTQPPLSACQRQKSEASKNPGAFRPQCYHDGSYKPMQCHHSTGQCWCVDVHGEEILGTILQAPDHPRCSLESPVVANTRHPPLGKMPVKQADADDIIIVESSTVVATEPVVTDGGFEDDEEKDVDEEIENEKIDNEKTELRFRDTFLSLFKDPLIFAGIIGGAVLALLCIVLLVMFTVYRMRKKDEGSYDLGEKGKLNSFGYTRAKDQEFFA